MTEPEKQNLALSIAGDVKVLESRDHYFGDREITFLIMDVEIGGGYLSRDHKGIWFDDNELVPFDLRGWECENYSFILQFLKSVKSKEIGRNDTEGEDRYRGA